ncbi:MAG: hypothetical protein ACI959_000659 [Limisphaerales bacterium]|jgi:hypothetical protein
MKYLILVIVLALYSFSIWADQSNELIVFEGSDWCANCRNLEKNVLSDSVFLSFIEAQNIQLVRADFPQRKKLKNEIKLRNKTLADKYNFDGKFPSIILSFSENENFEQISYSDDNVSELIKKIESILQ